MADIQGDLGKYLAGLPVMVEGANIAISQPSIKDICAYGEDDFLMAVEFFVKSKEIAEKFKNEGKSQLEYLNDFQVLLVIIQNDDASREQINNFFSIIFPNYIYEFDNGCINFRMKENEPIVGQLNPMNFDNFKQSVRELFLPIGVESEEQEFNPVNDRAAEIAAKLEKGRRQRAALKQGENGKGPKSIFANYASILSIGLNIDINVIFSYTAFQLFDSFRRYTTKLSYDLYQKIATTPMMDVSKMDEPDNWMDNIYK